MRGIIISGGGSKGSFQAGALKAVREFYPEGFDFGSGTSVGAVNVTGIGMFPKERFSEAVGYIEQMWVEHVQKTSDIWTLRKPLGLPALWNESVGKNSQLEKLLNKIVDIDAIQNSGVEIRYTTVDALSGELVVYSGQDLLKYGVKPILASSSYPLAFPAVEIEDRWETDGGVRDIAPLAPAIKAGCDELVVITTNRLSHLDPVGRDEISWIAPFGLRLFDIIEHEVLRNDIMHCERINEWLETGMLSHETGYRPIKITVIDPSVKLGNPLDFSHDQMVAQMEQGYADAWQILAAADLS